MPRRTTQIPRYVFAALFLVLELPVLAPFLVGAVVTRALSALVDGARHVARVVIPRWPCERRRGTPGLATAATHRDTSRAHSSGPAHSSSRLASSSIRSSRV
jgi:hypothetical protein